VKHQDEKCVKMQPPVCHITGSAQLFLNKNGEVRYARARHYKGLNDFKKPQFFYCKIEDLNKLETLLTSLNFHFPQAQPKQLGQKTSKEFHDQTSVSLLSGQPDSSLKFEMAGPVGFEPTTFSLEG
jgi:hypothetical protein